MPNKKIRIVGVGASAGGLDAFEKFFKNSPDVAGLAFVLIQHLDPEHESHLASILQRSTTMQVVEVTDNMVVFANRVYVIPPNRAMTIEQGILYLSEQKQPRGKRLPIDLFFTSLAAYAGSAAVGVVLSGSGSDGALGLLEIDRAGGVTIIQEPTSAQYESMPNSAIASVPEARVLPIEEMLPFLLSGEFHQKKRAASNQMYMNHDASDIFQVLMLLRSATGHDFTEYKKSTIKRRVERRMQQQHMADLHLYAAFLKENPVEMQLLLNELLINVTSFFRDPDAFEVLEKEVLPVLMREQNYSQVMRVWVAGCATGEEAYSVAILLREYMDRSNLEFRVQIYATDLDQDAITKARVGQYAAAIKKDVSPERLKAFFHEESGGYRINKQIRDMVVFAVQNLIKDPPLIKLDLLCCRNLMIYLEAELQNRLITKFHFALRPEGMLFLSPAESIGNHTELFSVFNRKFKFYEAIKTKVKIEKMLKANTQWVEVTDQHAQRNINKMEAKTLSDDDQDLKSSNQELQSINEELQSANEELETSKEELQSVNEELVTVNAELQVKIDQLAGIQNDMKNLLDNMNIGTIFLDEDLIIRRFTREAVRVFRLIDTDVGRPLQDITSNLLHIDLLDCARQVLATHQPYEVELSTQTSVWYLVHIQPYKTLDNVIKGVVMTFTDITKRVEAESATVLAKTLAEGIVDTVLEPLVVLNSELKVQSASRSFFTYFKVKPENTIGRLIYDLGNRQWDIPALRDLLETILPKHQSFEGYIVEHEFQEIGLKKMSLNARRIIDKNGNTQLILFAMQDV